MGSSGKGGPKLVEWEGARPTPPFLRSAQGVRVFLLGTCTAFTGVFGLMVYTSSFKPLPPIEYVMGTMWAVSSLFALWRLRRIAPRVAAVAEAGWAAGEPTPEVRKGWLMEWSGLHVQGVRAICVSAVFGGMTAGFAGSPVLLAVSGVLPLIVGVRYFPRRREAEALWYGPPRRDMGIV